MLKEAETIAHDLKKKSLQADAEYPRRGAASSGQLERC